MIEQLQHSLNLRMHMRDEEAKNGKNKGETDFMEGSASQNFLCFIEFFSCLLLVVSPSFLFFYRKILTIKSNDHFSFGIYTYTYIVLPHFSHKSVFQLQKFIFYSFFQIEPKISEGYSLTHLENISWFKILIWILRKNWNSFLKIYEIFFSFRKKKLKKCVWSCNAPCF